MPRVFNIAGPCDPGRHYMLPPERRLPQLDEVIERCEYFVLHAPRQAGKTTAFRALAQRLTASGRYAAVMLSLETGSMFAEPERAEAAILESWRASCRSQLPPELQPPPSSPAHAGVHGLLTEWALNCPRPLVLFLDEADALQGQPLLSVLRQLRAGFPSRPGAFPASVALVGMRDLRDYRVELGHLGGPSPFNVSAGSFTLGNFTVGEVEELYAQHTADTGQAFAPGAARRAHELSGGHPWLVNALARECVTRLVLSRDSAVQVEHVDTVAAALVSRQDTHLDSLGERLREPRVRAVIAPLLAGGVVPAISEDDRQYVLDLGLLREEPGGGLVVANPIYKAAMPRALTLPVRSNLAHVEPTWLDPGGRLDPARLLDAFTRFWRQHGTSLLVSAPYAEVAPQLVLLAFLDRVANGGGRVDREYAIGRGRIDVCLHWRDQRVAVEIKVARQGRRDPEPEGLEQLDTYLAGLGLQAGWLVIFGDPPGDEVNERDTTTSSGRRVTVLRI